MFGGQKFAIKANFGNFEGESAVGFSLKGLLASDLFGGGEQLALSGGFGVGLQERSMGGRVSAQLGW